MENHHLPWQAPSKWLMLVYWIVAPKHEANTSPSAESLSPQTTCHSKSPLPTVHLNDQKKVHRFLVAKRVSFRWVYLHQKKWTPSKIPTLFPNNNSARPARLEFGRMVGYLVTAVCEDLDRRCFLASCGSCELLWVSPDFRWKKWCSSSSIQRIFVSFFPCQLLLP